MTGEPHYFIAVPLSNDVKERFSLTQQQISNLPYKQWTDWQDMHITLKFLGPVSDIKLKALIHRLHQISFRGFTLKASNIETFGNPARPRVLYVSVELSKQLTALYQKIELASLEVGFSKENRIYIPHITLAKKWIGQNDWLNKLDQVKANVQGPIKIDVREFTLFRIYPNRIPKYRIIATFHEQGGGASGSIN
ncbi:MULTISPECIES: RNA 2',3'-cyclic phosphodiesterase [Virgibacillus]|uniref:RNA 2',3'-cyclic phosphodiesterase n=2 Tax=Virgibacillus TaxID=84406 RepID=A0A024Q9U4_9BACI|nr:MULTISPECIES: RNA 2',3'-cyclic phosphodiesterase [Virgibacillus]EQB35662.1 hypothetical protein M948_11505 [Virgibacillus sp. CM-4]GGJ50664.1 RNA 2',3'-cyclic phosphodiesterase [Virgibacillus kapii]CDQ39269.1 2'-5' RNA ligase [Virgibacillus massiliensis]